MTTTQTTVETVVARFGSYELRHVRRTLTAELVADCAAGVKGTQAHVGKLEMLAAVTAELEQRGALLDPPPFVDVSTITEYGLTQRLSYAVRVF